MRKLLEFVFFYKRNGIWFHNFFVQIIKQTIMKKAILLTALDAISKIILIYIESKGEKEEQW